MGDEEANAEDEDTARQLQLKLQALKTERKTLRDMRKLVQRELSRLEVENLELRSRHLRAQNGASSNVKARAIPTKMPTEELDVNSINKSELKLDVTCPTAVLDKMLQGHIFLQEQEEEDEDD